MENLPEFACHLRKGEHMLSMDIVKGYRLLRIHPSMRDWFLFSFAGKFYQCIALPFGWGRSPLWFTQVIALLARALRGLSYRVLCYLDDFLIVPAPFGTTSTKAHC